MSHDHEGHGAGGCCGGGHAHGHEHHAVVAGPGDELVMCAVRGNPTTRSQIEADNLVRDYENKRYYFCCSHCAELFDADPLQYTTAA